MTIFLLYLTESVPVKTEVYFENTIQKKMHPILDMFFDAESCPHPHTKDLLHPAGVQI